MDLLKNRKFLLVSLFLLLITALFVTNKTIATEVVIPNNEYTMTNNSITGIKSTWLDSLTPDSDGFTKISIVIPDKINGVNVTSIGANAFHTNRAASEENAVYSSYPNLRITKIDLSGATNLTIINKNAFYNQSGNLYSELDVSDFTLPANVSSIGDYAFCGLNGLKGSLVMPNSLITLSSYRTFQDCTGLTSIDLNNVKTISGSGYIFFRCTGVTSINLRSVQKFNCTDTFSSCTNLQGILTIPDSVTTLGPVTAANTFASCGSKSSGFTVQFPSNPQFTSIPQQTFNGAKITGNLVIPEGIIEIGKTAFGSGSFTGVTFPGSIKIINSAAFSGGTLLTAVNFPKILSHSDGLQIHNQAFKNFSATTLDIPSYVTGLGSECFMSTGNVLSTVYLNADPSIPFNAGSGSNSPFSGMESNTGSLIIAKNVADFKEWENKTGANVTANFKKRLTYEVTVNFCNPSNDEPISSISPIIRLFNRSICYEKNASTNAWSQNTDYSLPALPAEYSEAKGWSFTKTGSVVTSLPTQLVTGTIFYPVEGIKHEYVWLGKYQQTLLEGVSSDDDPRLNGLTEGQDYIKEEFNAGTSSSFIKYYKIEPIRWRILEQNDKQYTLLSESILDSRIFANSASGQLVRWGTSDIRLWLNGTGDYTSSGFYSKAFSPKDASLIQNITLSDVNTADKVYLMDYATCTKFEDSADLVPDHKNNSYADQKMKLITFGTSYYATWWLRTFMADLSPSYSSYLFPLVLNSSATGVLYPSANTSGIGIRPMISIDLGHQKIFTHTGTYNDPYVISDTSVALSASDFIFTPDSATYDGTVKNVLLSANKSLSSETQTKINALINTEPSLVSIGYSKDGWVQSTTAPIDVGEYEVKIKILPNSDFEANEEGIILKKAFTINPATLISIAQPDSITGLENGSPATSTSLGLPDSVGILTNPVSALESDSNVNVLWDVEGSQYNPLSTKKQTFTVMGTVKLSNNFVNSNNVSLKISILVTVNGQIHQIKYMNFDGSEITNLDPVYPKEYMEGVGLTFPTNTPYDFKNYDFLGWWDCPLDKFKKLSLPGIGYENEYSLDFSIGNKITLISANEIGEITLYARFTSNMFDQDVSGRENYVFAAPGVFPNGSTASITVLDPSMEEYQKTINGIDDSSDKNFKIVEFDLFDTEGNKIQPHSFFGNAVIGFKIPEGYNADDVSLWRVVLGGQDIKLREIIWVDPENSNLKYIEGETDHFSPYALIEPESEKSQWPTGDTTVHNIILLIFVLTISTIMLVIFGKTKIKVRK